MITQNFNTGRLVTTTTKKATPSACYRCGKLHWAKDCPYRTKNVKTAINSDIGTPSVETKNYLKQNQTYKSEDESDKVVR